VFLNGEIIFLTSELALMQFLNNCSWTISRRDEKDKLSEIVALFGRPVKVPHPVNKVLHYS